MRTRLPRWLSGKESVCQDRRHKVLSLGQEEPPEKGLATHSSILAWKIPDRGAWLATAHGVTRSQVRLHTAQAWRHEQLSSFLIWSVESFGCNLHSYIPVQGLLSPRYSRQPEIAARTCTQTYVQRGDTWSHRRKDTETVWAKWSQPHRSKGKLSSEVGILS